MSNSKEQDKDVFDFESDVFKFDNDTTNGGRSSNKDELGDILASADLEDMKFSSGDNFWEDNLYKDFFKDNKSGRTSPATNGSLDSATRTMPIATKDELKAFSNAEKTRPAPTKNGNMPNGNGRGRNEDRDMRIREGRGKGQTEEKKMGRKPVRRRRPRLTGVRYYLFILVVSIILACITWVSANDVFALNKKPITAIVTIPENYSMSKVASILKKNGIIEYKSLFRLFGALTKADKKIDSGTYKLTTDLDYRALISRMQEGSSDEIVKVTIPEGKTMVEIFDILQNEGVCSAEKLKDTAANYNYEYLFLDKSTLGNAKRLEGYLFPDTYEFYLSDNPVDVVKKFLDNFKNKVTETMYAKAQTMGYSMAEIITVASLIEKEAADADEADYVASVIYNRLNSKDFPYLQIDATIQYFLPERTEKVLDEHLKIDNPYNTYMYKGLPPGPISNPGITSIKAALNPANTKYYFYALDKSGFHQFFTNSTAFDKFVNSADYGG